MKKLTLAKKMALVSAATVVSVAAQNVMAHTGFKDVVQEGVASYNAVNTSHGCLTNEIPEGGSGVRLDIVAASVVFPNSADPTKAVVTKLDPTTGALIETVDSSVGLSGDIVGSLPNVGFTNLGLGLVQPGLFPNFIPKMEGTLIRGFASHNGPKPFASAPIYQSVASSASLSPFRVGAIKFKPESCAVSLRVRVAAANWCLRTKANDTNPDRVDVWIGHMTAKFNDPKVMPYTKAELEAGKVHWPTMTVARNLVTNPLSADCKTTYNLVIEPSDADIDANLPMPRGLAPTGAPQYYWPGK